jgi:hypothetical protein
MLKKSPFTPAMARWSVAMRETVARAAIAGGWSSPVDTCGSRRSTSSRSPSTGPPAPVVWNVRNTTPGQTRHVPVYRTPAAWAGPASATATTGTSSTDSVLRNIGTILDAGSVNSSPARVAAA